MTKTFEIGQVVKWKAGGKVSRIDGVVGKWVLGTVESIEDNDDGRGLALTVRKHHDSIIALASVSVSKATAV